MKKIFFTLFLFLSIHGFSQIPKDSIEWIWKGKIVSEKEWDDSSRAFNKWYYYTYYNRQLYVADSIRKLYNNRRSKYKK